MIAEAQRNQAEDQQIRQQVDARNELDAVAYQVERQLAEGGDAIPSHERARAEMGVYRRPARRSRRRRRWSACAPSPASSSRPSKG